jgi:hypothetical protein
MTEIGWSQNAWTARFRQALQGSEHLILTVHPAIRLFGAILLFINFLIGLGFVIPSASRAEGSPWVAFLVFGVFTPIGYCMTFSVLRLEFDLVRRRWRHLRGVAPFVRRAEGSLGDWEQMRLERGERAAPGGQGGTYAVWALTLRARGDFRPAIALPNFEFPCHRVGVAEATALA